jgi:hypothetical protein
MSVAPDSNDRQAEIDHRQEEIRRRLEELKELEEAKQAEERAAQAPAPVDPATLTPDQQQALAALREVGQRGRTALDRKFPTAWSPSKNPEHPVEIAAALVTRIEPHGGPSTTFRTYSAVVEIRDGQGREWAIWCNKPDGKLWNTLLRLRLQPGDVIALHDNGRRPSQRDPSRTVHDIDLVRIGDDTGGGQIDYDKLDRAPEVPVPTPEQRPPDPDDDIPF